MKKLWIISVAFIGAFISCEKETEVENSQGEEHPITYLTATCEGDSTKGSVDPNGVFTWNAGDQIAVYTTAGGGYDAGYKISDPLDAEYDGKSTAVFSFSGDNLFEDEYRRNFAVFPASIVYDFTGDFTESASGTPGSGTPGYFDINISSSKLNLYLPTDYNLSEILETKSPTPMIASNIPGNGLSFKVLCPLLRLTLKDLPSDLTDIEVWLDSAPTSGFFQLTDVAPGTTAITTADVVEGWGFTGFFLNNDLGGPCPRDLIINLPIPVGTYETITCLPYTQYFGELTRRIKSAGNSWNPGRKDSAELTFGMPVFSVASDKKVVFAPGNLKYSNKQWSFHANQYDQCFTLAGDVSSFYNQSGTFDLFGWAASGKAPVGEEENATNPWETGDKAVYGPGELAHNVNFASGWDWGMNSINWETAGIWRTPTNDEFNYLINTRPNASNKIGPARLKDGISYYYDGMIILPDSFVDPKLSDRNDGRFVRYSRFGYEPVTWNEYTLENWEVMEKAGAVFLPITTYREGKQVSAPSYGMYWTSTFYNTVDHKNPYMLLVFGIDNGIEPNTDYLMPASSGVAVRLVRDVPINDI